MKKARQQTNATCLDCGACHKTMLRIGAFVLCYYCALNDFADMTYDPKSDVYRQRLKKLENLP